MMTRTTRHAGFTWVLGCLTAFGTALGTASGCGESAPATEDTTVDYANSDGGHSGTDHEGGSASSGGGSTSGDAGATGTGGSATEEEPTPGPGSGPALVTVAEGCVEDRDFVGQLYPKPDDPTRGGRVASAPLDAAYDAGIAALYASLPAEGTAAEGLALAITDATVTATGFGTNAAKQFWLQDGKAAVQVRMMTPVTVGGQEAAVKVGSKLSLTVRSVRNYRGSLQIESADGFTFTGTEQPIYLDDRTGKDITALDVHRVIRVTGLLTGTATECGGKSKCWKLDYKGKTEVQFRSASTFIATGACVTFVGPVAAFGGAPQLDTANFSWLRTSKEL